MAGMLAADPHLPLCRHRLRKGDVPLLNLRQVNFLRGGWRAVTLKFGTSGLRGLVNELQGSPAFTYTLAFVRMLMGRGALHEGSRAYVGGDLRASSPDIAQLVHAAIAEAGLVPVDRGALPTPALALHANSKSAPAIIVTGSHLSEDRNGLRFYRAQILEG
jgi:phosphomannomutase